MMTPNTERLELVIKAARESKNPAGFNMDVYINGEYIGLSSTPNPHCGSPGCLLGHLAAREDLQDFLTFDEHRGMVFAGQTRTEIDWDESDNQVEREVPKPARYDDAELHEWFGINEEQATALFGPNGCDDARNIEDAVAYVQAFIDANKANAKSRAALNAR